MLSKKKPSVKTPSQAYAASQNARLICFIGLDGAGKSTQCKYLIEALKKQGLNYRYTPCRFESPLLGIALFWARLIMAPKGRNMRDYNQRMETKKHWLLNPFLRNSYRIFVNWSYLFQVAMRVKLPLLLRRNLVCDRYIYDSVIDQAVEFNYTTQEMERRLRWYFRRAPRPMRVFFLDVPETVAYQRNLSKNEGFTMNYFSMRRRLYQTLALWPEVVVLDGTQALESIHAQILKAVALQPPEEATQG